MGEDLQDDHQAPFRDAGEAAVTAAIGSSVRRARTGGAMLGDAAQLRLQGTATAIPYEVFLALPYVVTLFALMVRARRSGTPAALAVPFVRGRPT